jgi:hypothetical protein
VGGANFKELPGMFSYFFSCDSNTHFCTSLLYSSLLLLNLRNGGEPLSQKNEWQDYLQLIRDFI